MPPKAQKGLVMTREEALEVFSTVKGRIERFKECGCRFPLWTITERDEEAIDMAIDYLQTGLKCCEECKYYRCGDTFFPFCDKPKLKGKSADICIIDEPIEGDIDFHCDLKHNRMTWFNNITESPNEVDEKNDEVIEPSDLISRADVLGYIERLKTCGLGKNKSLDYIGKYVERMPSKVIDLKGQGTIVTMPSVSAERVVADGVAVKIDEESYEIGYTDGQRSAERSGEWLDVQNEPYCECSVCGAYIDNLDDDYAFCPRCGARMKGEK